MGHHLTKKGRYKSDKYIWCPEDFLALHLDGPLEQETALFFADRTKDRELADDLRTAVKNMRDEQQKCKTDYFD